MKTDSEQKLAEIAARAQSGQKISSEEEAFIIACIDETLKRLEANFAKIKEEN